MSRLAFSIRSKVVLAFAAVLCCTIGLGLFGLTRVDSVNGAAAVVGNNALPSTRILGELSYHTMRFRQLEATRTLAPDAAAKAQEAASMQRVGAQAAKSLQDFAPFVVSGEARRLADDMSRMWAAYLVQDARFLTIDDTGAAAGFYRGEMRTLFNQFQDALQAQISFNVKQATEAVDHGAALGGSARIWIVGVLGTTTVLCAIIGWLMVRGISMPIAAMTQAMRRLADRDTAVDVYGLGRNDEVGAMARAVEVFKANAIERSRLEDEQTVQEERSAREKHAALMTMAEKIESATDEALETVGARTAKMVATAEAMSASAGRTGTSAEGAATAATHALANAQTVASAAEQLAASIREIGGQVHQSSAMIGQAVQAGNETRRTIETLNEQVGRIGVVADMIGEIAAKTNLLALNATIEAARAGDAGKGFAVVASEVKQLATQTARSTEEISRHIGDVRAATGASVAAVGRIDQTIGEVNAIAGSIAAAVEEQGAATAEIARNVSETASAANEMTRRITEVSAEAQQTGEHSTQVRDDAAALNTVVDGLRHSVTRVVRTSTEEVNRRHLQRYAVNLPCRLSVAGLGTQSARVVDLGEGGASLRDAPRLAQGASGTLAVDGVNSALPFTVEAVAEGVAHVAFALDAAATGSLRQALRRFAGRLAA